VKLLLTRLLVCYAQGPATYQQRRNAKTLLVFFETKLIALYQRRTNYPPFKNYILLSQLKAVAFEILFNNIFLIKNGLHMKKLVFAFSGVILCFLLSCNDKTQTHEGGMSEKAKKNLENTKAIVGMFEKGDFSKAGDYIAADGVDHSGPMGEIKGLDSLKANFSRFATMVSNVKNEVTKGLADDDYSMVWLNQSWTAKMDDPMMGLKAGQEGHMQSVEVCKHGADGKITDHWTFMGMTDAMKMMQMPKN
jgi:hypothetical protein